MNTPTVTETRRAGADPSVDYVALDRACEEARELYPDAVEVRPVLSYGRAMADVRFADRTGRVYAPVWNA